MMSRHTVSSVGFVVLAVGLLAIGGCVAPQSATARRPKTIMFMLDGLRADALEAADAPNIMRLRNGTWQPGYRGLWSRNGRVVPDAEPSSAANHAALATCTVAAKNGVSRNGMIGSGHFDRWPTVLQRIVEKQPDAKALFAYSWYQDRDLGKHPRVRFLEQSDAANGAALPKIMAAADAPDAVLYFIDLPDHLGHTTGFYPYTTGYLHAIHETDRWIGAVLDAIATRPSFANEDWIIAVTADHGGYNKIHGRWGGLGHSSTIPLVAAGRHFEQGRIPGAPHHYDLTATILAHFGFNVASLGLDGKVLGKAASAPTPRSLKDGLAVFLPFDGSFANKAGKEPTTKAFGTAKCVDAGFLGGGLHFDGGTNVVGGVRLEGSEKLSFGPNGAFAVSFWARLPAEQAGDPLLFGNKDWRLSTNPGMALTAAKPAPNNTKPGVTFNCARKGGERQVELSAYHPTPDAWTFFAIVRSAEGVVTFYHGNVDGKFYAISDDASDLVPTSGLPFVLGQDGTGAYRFGLTGDMDEFALWTRELTTEDVKRIFESGRKGLGIDDL